MNGTGREADDSWWLQGEAIVALIGRSARRSELPPGLSPLPGPGLVTATRFEGSPHGPFLELALCEPARLGARVGWCRTQVVVDRPEVQQASLARWGFPAVLGALDWVADGTDRSLTWRDGGLVVSGSVRRPALPWAAPQRSLQRRGADNVVAPTRMRGLAHVCLVALTEVPAVSIPGAPGRSEPWPVGRHAGAVITGVHVRWSPARATTVVHLNRRTAPLAEPAMYRPRAGV